MSIDNVVPLAPVAPVNSLTRPAPTQSSAPTEAKTSTVGKKNSAPATIWDKIVAWCSDKSSKVRWFIIQYSGVLLYVVVFAFIALISVPLWSLFRQWRRHRNDTRVHQIEAGRTTEGNVVHLNNKAGKLLSIRTEEMVEHLKPYIRLFQIPSGRGFHVSDEGRVLAMAGHQDEDGEWFLPAGATDFMKAAAVVDHLARSEAAQRLYKLGRIQSRAA
jgi:hypothetical protein